MFFRSLLGAPVATAAAIAAPVNSNVVMARGAFPECECGFGYLLHKLDGHRPKGLGRWIGYVECCNPGCRYFRKALALPSIAMAPADPRIVWAIEAQERAYAEQDKRWAREKAEHTT